MSNNRIEWNKVRNAKYKLERIEGILSDPGQSASPEEVYSNADLSDVADPMKIEVIDGDGLDGTTPTIGGVSTASKAGRTPVKVKGNTKYTYRLTVTDSDGRDYKFISNTLTRPEKPSLTLSTINTSTVRAVINPAINDAWGGGNKGNTSYELKWFNSDPLTTTPSASGMFSHNYGGSMTRDLSGLSPNRKYFFSIQGKNDSGLGQPNYGNRFTQPEQAVFDKYESDNKNHVRFIWKGPASDDGTAETKYEVRYTQNSSANFDASTVLVSHNSGFGPNAFAPHSQINGLPSNTLVYLHVKSKNRDSENITKFTGLTRPGMPNKILGGFRSTGTNSAAIDLQAAEVSNRNSLSIEYNFKRHDGSNSSTGSLTIDNVGSGSRSFTGLQASQKYLCSFRASNPAGDSGWSSDEVAITTPDKPTSVELLKLGKYIYVMAGVPSSISNHKGWGSAKLCVQYTKESFRYFEWNLIDGGNISFPTEFAPLFTTQYSGTVWIEVSEGGVTKSSESITFTDVTITY